MPKPPLLVHNGTFLVHAQAAAGCGPLQAVPEGGGRAHDESARLPARQGSRRCLQGAGVSGSQDDGPLEGWIAGGPLSRRSRGTPDRMHSPTHGDEDGARCPLGAHVTARQSARFTRFCRPNRQPAPDAPPRHRLRRTTCRKNASPSLAGEAPTPSAASCFSPQRQHRTPVRVHPEAMDELRRRSSSRATTAIRSPAPATATAAWSTPAALQARRVRRQGAHGDPGRPADGAHPRSCAPSFPNFVITKGGDYFFMPSMTGLVLLASGKVSTK